MCDDRSRLFLHLRVSVLLNQIPIWQHIVLVLLLFEINAIKILKFMQ